MRDPELVVRAQLAASALEGAWQRWRVVHGDAADPRPAISSYVGYSLNEPLGQPRVVFGLAAEDAEQLAALIERHGRGEPAYAAAGLPGVRDVPARTGALAVTVPGPRQAPLSAADIGLGRALADVLLADENAGYDEPVYRQAAAAMKQAAAAREDAGRSKLADLVSPEWMGSLAMAAFTARSEAEARIRAALTKPDEDEPEADEPAQDQPAEDRPAEDQLAEASQATAEDQLAEASQAAAEDQPADPSQAAAEAGGDAVPRIDATDVLEPLPSRESPAVTELDENDPGEQDVDDDVPDQDDHEVVAIVPSDEPDTGVVRRSRVTRNRPIARLSKTKRPDASTRAAGS